MASKVKALSTYLLARKWEAGPSCLINHSIYPKHYATSFLGFLFLRLLRQSCPEMGKPAKEVSPFAEEKAQNETQQRTAPSPHHLHPLQLGSPAPNPVLYTRYSKRILCPDLCRSFYLLGDNGTTKYRSSSLSPFKGIVMAKSSFQSLESFGKESAWKTAFTLSFSPSVTLPFIYAREFLH